MNTKDVNLIFFDTPARFAEVKSQISLRSYKTVNQFENFSEFESYIKRHNMTEEYIVVFIHIVAETLEGYHSGLKDDLHSVYPKLKPKWITRNNSSIKPKDIDQPVYTYLHIKNRIENDEIVAHKISDLLSDDENTCDNTCSGLEIEPNNIEYAIITALEDDEMETVLPMIQKRGTIENRNILIEYGDFKNDPSKKIVYASQPTTGMIDAAILATELIVRFQPKFLIMAGVLGGKPEEVNIGDIVVATKVFTIDKGKLTDEGFVDEIELSNTDSSVLNLLKRNKKEILRCIEDLDNTRKNRLEAHFGPIACVRQVIDKKDYFEERLISKDRKTIALEMESYSIARACELVNNGETVPLIIKSAMDNTIDKVDEAKTYAAWTSARFVQCILEKDFI